MHRRAFFGLSAAAFMAACAPLPRANPLSASDAAGLVFSDITVSTSGAAFANARAGDFRSQLAPTLRAELRQEFSDRIAPTGTARIVVDVASLNVANSLRTATGSDQSRLTGSVRIVRDGVTLATYNVDVTAGEAAETRTGTLIGAAVNSSNRFFRRLNADFAEETRALVEA